MSPPFRPPPHIKTSFHLHTPSSPLTARSNSTVSPPTSSCRCPLRISSARRKAVRGSHRSLPSGGGRCFSEAHSLCSSRTAAWRGHSDVGARPRAQGWCWISERPERGAVSEEKQRGIPPLSHTLLSLLSQRTVLHARFQDAPTAPRKKACSCWVGSVGGSGSLMHCGGPCPKGGNYTGSTTVPCTTPNRPRLLISPASPSTERSSTRPVVRTLLFYLPHTLRTPPLFHPLPFSPPFPLSPARLPSHRSLAAQTPISPSFPSPPFSTLDSRTASARFSYKV